MIRWGLLTGWGFFGVTAVSCTTRERGDQGGELSAEGYAGGGYHGGVGGAGVASGGETFAGELAVDVEGLAVDFRCGRRDGGRRPCPSGGRTRYCCRSGGKPAPRAEVDSSADFFIKEGIAGELCDGVVGADGTFAEETGHLTSMSSIWKRKGFAFIGGGVDDFFSVFEGEF